MPKAYLPSGRVRAVDPMSMLTLNRRRRQRAGSLLVLLYLSCSALLDVGHSHFVPDNAGGMRHFLSHDCGSREIHVPIGTDDRCALCERNQQFVSTVTPLPIPIHHSEATVLIVFYPATSTDVAFDSFYKRGPPPAHT